jgi:hypothetical protein
MDCHNRPAHRFRSPERAVDIYLDVGKIDVTLPYVKREAVAALVGDYGDVETAQAQITKHLTDFYRDNYPDVWSAREDLVSQAADEVKEIYDTNFFPDMKVDWRTYPDNIGHKNSAGCFRCHAGNHVNQHGEKISHECSICHTFLNPVAENGRSGIIQEGAFIHPVELVGMHAALNCHLCHTGGVAPVASCGGCHDKQQGLYGATASVLADFNVEANSMSGSVDCESCHDLSEPHSLEAVDIQCMDCHEDEEEKYEGMLARWSDAVGKKRARADSELQNLMTWINQHHAEGIDDEATLLWTHRSLDTLQFLSEAGPLHNPDAALRIYEALAGGAAERLAQLRAAQVTPEP